MDEHISRILKMLEEGKISASEAETLIAALRTQAGASPPPPSPPPPHAGGRAGETRAESAASEGESGAKSFEFQWGRRKGFVFDLGGLGKSISDAVRKIDPERIMRDAGVNVSREARRWHERMRTWRFGDGEDGRPENAFGLPTARATENLVFEVAPEASVDIENNWGGIIVVGGGDRVTVDIEKEAWAATEEEAQARLRDLKAEMMSHQVPGTGATRMEIRVTAPEGWRDGVLNLRLGVPERVAMRLRTLFGEVRVSDMAARVEAQSVSGSVALENVRQPEGAAEPASEPVEGAKTQASVRYWARAESISGDMRAVNIGGLLHMASKSGEVVAEGLARGGEVMSVSGDVRVKNAEGDALDAKSVSGDVLVEEAGRQSAMRLNLETVSGDVRLAGARGSVTLKTVSGDAVAERLDAQTLQCQTVSGDMRLTLEGAFIGTLTANTVSGDVFIGLPGTGSFRFTLGTQSGDLHCGHAAQDSNHTETLWTGTVGTGTGTISVQTRSGDVRLDRPE